METILCDSDSASPVLVEGLLGDVHLSERLSICVFD